MNKSKTYVRAVLVYVVNPSTHDVFLARNRKGPCKDMLNGFGGEIEIGEIAAEAAQRELKKETGICVPLEHLQFYGKIEFVNVESDGWRQTVDCFIYILFTLDPHPIVQINERELYDCGKYNIDNLPINDMTHGDHLWVRALLHERKLHHALIERDAESCSILFQKIEFEEY